MTTSLKEIVGELSGSSAEKQQIAASVIHALWSEENAVDRVHPEWEAELDSRNAQIPCRQSRCFVSVRNWLIIGITADATFYRS